MKLKHPNHWIDDKAMEHTEGKPDIYNEGHQTIPLNYKGASGHTMTYNYEISNYHINKMIRDAMDTQLGQEVKIHEVALDDDVRERIFTATMTLPTHKRKINFTLITTIQPDGTFKNGMNHPDGFKEKEAVFSFDEEQEDNLFGSQAEFPAIDPIAEDILTSRIVNHIHGYAIPRAWTRAFSRCDNSNVKRHAPEEAGWAREVYGQSKENTPDSFQMNGFGYTKHNTEGITTYSHTNRNGSDKVEDWTITLFEEDESKMIKHFNDAWGHKLPKLYNWNDTMVMNDYLKSKNIERTDEQWKEKIKEKEAAVAEILNREETMRMDTELQGRIEEAVNQPQPHTREEKEADIEANYGIEDETSAEYYEDEYDYYNECPTELDDSEIPPYGFANETHDYEYSYQHEEEYEIEVIEPEIVRPAVIEDTSIPKKVDFEMAKKYDLDTIIQADLIDLIRRRELPPFLFATKHEDTIQNENGIERVRQHARTSFATDEPVLAKIEEYLNKQKANHCLKGDGVYEKEIRDIYVASLTNDLKKKKEALRKLHKWNATNGNENNKEHFVQVLNQIKKAIASTEVYELSIQDDPLQISKMLPSEYKTGEHFNGLFANNFVPNKRAFDRVFATISTDNPDFAHLTLKEMNEHNERAQADRVKLKEILDKEMEKVIDKESDQIESKVAPTPSLFDTQPSKVDVQPPTQITLKEPSMVVQPKKEEITPVIAHHHPQTSEAEAKAGGQKEMMSLFSTKELKELF